MSMFYMPVKVFEEDNAVINHAHEIASFGRKALLVTGARSAKACGAYDDVCRALESENTGFVLFDRVEENPSIETVMEARDFGLREGADFVIGIGGGSPLDAAKAIALMMCKADKDISYLYGPDGDSSSLPVVAVPTTCGTGSEVTAVSVLTNTPKQIKKSIPHKLFAQLALIDGKYLKAAPKNVLANTAFDALTHLIECYLNTKSTPYSRMCVDAGLKTWAESLCVLKGEKEANDMDRMNMMRASMFAGMSIAHTGTSLPHGLSYALTTHLGVRHGKATAYFTAGYLAEADEADRDYLLRTAGFASLEDFRQVFHSACGPLDIPENELRRVLDLSVEETAANPAKLSAVPFAAGPDTVRRIAYYELEH